MEEENELNFSIENPRQHLCLTIFDIISFLKDVRLNNLRDEVTYSIVVNYNRHLESQHHIDDDMDGPAIRNKYDQLPNDLKLKMQKKVIIFDLDAKYFIEEIFNFIDIQHRHYVKDVSSFGGLLNMYSFGAIILTGALFIIYRTSQVYRTDGVVTNGDSFVSYLFEMLKGFM